MTAIWVFDWLNGLKGALAPNLISEKQFPKVFAWIDRFNKAFKVAKGSAPKPTTLKGEEALKRVMTADWADEAADFNANDPLGLESGQEVEVWPTDTGVKHRDRGTLIGLNEEEVVLSVRLEGQVGEVRLHFPRANFRIRAVKSARSKL